MTHIMNLEPSAFLKIEKGIKTIELRLNDKKRQKNTRRTKNLMCMLAKRAVYTSVLLF